MTKKIALSTFIIVAMLSLTLISCSKSSGETHSGTVTDYQIKNCRPEGNYVVMLELDSKLFIMNCYKPYSLFQQPYSNNLIPNYA